MLTKRQQWLLLLGNWGAFQSHIMFLLPPDKQKLLQQCWVAVEKGLHLAPGPDFRHDWNSSIQVWTSSNHSLKWISFFWFWINNLSTSLKSNFIQEFSKQAFFPQTKSSERSAASVLMIFYPPHRPHRLPSHCLHQLRKSENSGNVSAKIPELLFVLDRKS